MSELQLALALSLKKPAITIKFQLQLQLEAIIYQLPSLIQLFISGLNYQKFTIVIIRVCFTNV